MPDWAVEESGRSTPYSPYIPYGYRGRGCRSRYGGVRWRYIGRTAGRGSAGTSRCSTHSTPCRIVVTRRGETAATSPTRDQGASSSAPTGARVTANAARPSIPSRSERAVRPAGNASCRTRIDRPSHRASRRMSSNSCTRDSNPNPHGRRCDRLDHRAHARHRDSHRRKQPPQACRDGATSSRHTLTGIRVGWVQLEPPDRGHFRLPEPEGTLGHLCLQCVLTRPHLPWR